MMSTKHPITPPPELVQQWRIEGYGLPGTISEYVATRAAQWGADYELMACLDHLVNQGWFTADHEAIQDLKASRRPKPPSLKEQALDALAHIATGPNPTAFLDCQDTIRRALEELPD